jgi:hypothetical protein
MARLPVCRLFRQPSTLPMKVPVDVSDEVRELQECLRRSG